MATTEWDFDLAHSSVNFHIRHLMVSKVHGRFTKWSGTLALDEQDLTKSRFDVTIDAASIDTREDKRDEHLRSADFLDVASFPTITYKSTQIEREGEDTYRVLGELTIHGVTRPVALEVEGGARVTDPWGGTRTGFSAKTSISRKDFGLTWNVALEAGGFLVGDKLDITLEIEAIKKSATAAA
ncbi:MAG TPA: YceI family protein [Kofleriaceae bacterium]|nr:YceI family protein [Kofleriaceae bacterium]